MNLVKLDYVVQIVQLVRDIRTYRPNSHIVNTTRLSLGSPKKYISTENSRYILAIITDVSLNYSVYEK